MATGMKKRSLKSPRAANADQIAAEAATVFVRANIERKRAELEYDEAREVLKTWMGDELSRVLPDGRTVIRALTPMEPKMINRKAYIQEIFKVIAAD